MAQERSVRIETDPGTEAWFSVVRAYNECSATISQRLAPLGLSILQHEVLVNLLFTPGLSQQELARRCFSAKSGISMLVARMEKDGTITRAPDRDDTRVLRLFLSAAGQSLAEKVHAIQKDVVAQMVSVFPPEDLPVMKARMDQTSERLRQMREGG